MSSGAPHSLVSKINGACSACRGLVVPLLLPDKAASSTPADPPRPWDRTSVIAHISLPLPRHEEARGAPGPDPLQAGPVHLWASRAPSVPLKDSLNQLNLPPLLVLRTRWPPIPGPAGEPTADGQPGATRAPGGFQRVHCGEPYPTAAGLARHWELQCPPRAPGCFPCKHCDKEYGSLGALKMHLRTHTRPCPCAVCGKAFSRPWLLQGHMRTHTGEKPYACPHCSRAFADRSNLRAHLQTHADTKKYQCKNCAKTFSRMSLLARHQESGCCPGP